MTDTQRQPRRGALAVVALTLLVGACATQDRQAQVERAVQDVMKADAASLEAIMLTVANPKEAVSYFETALEAEPGRVDLKRGLAGALMRTGEYRRARTLWAEVVESPEATREDSVSLAEALIRLGEWDEAEKVLDSVPPTHETYKRYRLEAMIADRNEEWKKADAFYETAAGLTAEPAGVLNNWGYSKLSRGNAAAAESLFAEALRADPTLFRAKNNLMIARGAQGNYDMPVIDVTQQERARLLYTLGLAAMKRGDEAIGRGLIEDAAASAPRYFEEAERALAALDGAGAG